MLRRYWLSLLLILCCLAARSTGRAAQAQPERVPIGVIQGTGDVSPFLGQIVAFEGVVTGRYEDRNQRGDTYYTLFVQDLPGEEDGDLATSDGVPVFLGGRPPSITVGDQIRVTGEVTEFYGLTEISHREVAVQVINRDQPLPAAVALQPPTDDEALLAEYYEALEGMRVRLPGLSRVVGPTYSGCGFAVVPADNRLSRIMRHQLEDSVGPIIPVLHHSDVTCEGFPAVRTGDRVSGLEGPLTYSFDLFRIVHQDPEVLSTYLAPSISPPVAPEPAPDTISIATFNLGNYFDTVDDTGDNAEPKLTPHELDVKRAKLAHTIGITLRCPTLIGVQEVENEVLLLALAEAAARHCPFTYQVTHRDSVDARGIDVALLSDPRRVRVTAASLQQRCAPLSTGVSDVTVECPAGEEPLFSRPPLQVDLRVDGRPFTLFINHFKSKRGGEAETMPRRMAQAKHVNERVGDLLADDPAAAVIVLGDFNDYLRSEPMAALTDGGKLHHALLRVPPEEQYSYIFSGASQLIDGILLSPALLDELAAAAILHVNADYPSALAGDMSPGGLPYKSSDHDPSLVILQVGREKPVPTVMVSTPTAAEVAVEPTETVVATVTSAVIAAVDNPPQRPGGPPLDRLLVAVGLLLILLPGLLCWRRR